MRFGQVLLAAMAAILVTAAAPAPNPNPNPYEILSAALAADHRCGLLNVIEHEALQRALNDLERQPSARALVPGGDFAGFTRASAARAAALDCASQAAGDAVSGGRTKALLDLATAAVIGATLSSGPQPFTAHQKDLALALNTYLDRVLGADVTLYIDPAQAAAQAVLQAKPAEARDRLNAVLGDVDFQGAAESAGYKATVFAPGWVRLTDNGGMPILVGRREACRSADPAIAGGFQCHLLIRNGAVSAFFRDSVDAARPTPTPGVVRLYVRRPDAPVRTAQGESVAHTAGWRGNAAAYEGIKSFAPFLGAATYEFPPAASAAVMNQTATDEAELAIVSAATAREQAGPPTNLFRLEGLLNEQRLRRPN